MINFKTETLGIMKEKGLTKDDIVFIGTRDFKISIDEFWALADVEYYNGYGGLGIPSDLIVVFKDSWLERYSYDGEEHWEYKKYPTAPSSTKIIQKIVYPDESAWMLEKPLRAT